MDENKTLIIKNIIGPHLGELLLEWQSVAQETHNESIRYDLPFFSNSLRVSVRGRFILLNKTPTIVTDLYLFPKGKYKKKLSLIVAMNFIKQGDSPILGIKQIPVESFLRLPVITYPRTFLTEEERSKVLISVKDFINRSTNSLLED